VTPVVSPQRTVFEQMVSVWKLVPNTCAREIGVVSGFSFEDIEHLAPPSCAENRRIGNLEMASAVTPFS
jgi:hypothetical protein